MLEHPKWNIPLERWGLKAEHYKFLNSEETITEGREEQNWLRIILHKLKKLFEMA